MTSVAKQANASLSLDGKYCVVSGGTQGIGAAIANRLAVAGSSVTIIGRNQELANQVLAQLRQKTPADSHASFEFIKADLTLRSEIKRVAEEIATKAGKNGVTYLFQTQGMTPNGKWQETPEGIESRFALQCLSKFGLLYYLTEKNILKEAAVSICAPGGSTSSFDATDCSLAKAKANGSYGFMKSAERDGLVVDAITQEFNEKYPHIKFHHLFPGVVNTSAAANAGLPSILQFGFKLAGPVIAASPQSYAEVPIHIATTSKEPRYASTFFGTLKDTTPNKWTLIKENRSAVFSNMTSILAGSQS